MNLDQFVNQVKELYDKELISVVLYGSAATEDFSKRYSDYNTIIVLKKVTPNALAKSNKLVKKWVKENNPLPLFFDLEYIETSTDVFPIEFHDIKSNRKILYGEDPFTNIEISKTNLRHQCESELRGKILQLEARFVEISSHEKKMAKLMLDSFSGFLSIFKGVIWLLGHEPDTKKRDLVERLATIIEFNPTIFMELLDIRDGDAILPRHDALEKFEDYLTQIKTITNFVDKYDI